MRVWKAKLSLFRDEEFKWKTSFTFELQEKGYEYDEYYGWELSLNKKTIDSIPHYLWINNRLSYAEEIEVIQGFNRKLKDMELQSVELRFREELRKELDENMKEYTLNYMSKIQSLYSDIIQKGVSTKTN